MPRKNVGPPAASGDVASYKYPTKRKNIPPAGLESQGILQEAPKLRYEYNPHLPPTLRSATDATETDRLPELLQTSRKRALTEDEARTLAAALRNHEPWLEWSGKREKPWFEVEPVALHIHERVSTQAILRVLARQDVQRELFADPQQSYAEAVQFYKYDVDWSNRLILGDSLQVMASLARREDLAGKVQMIYFDPPYGIKFSSNFQPQLGQRDVKDREQDLTREPEMVKAYRDTWTLGIHSYLAYLRDRLAMAKELLANTGSIFVQISDENIHRVRCLMDEVFRADNFISLITVKKTGGMGEARLDNVSDYLLWYSRDFDGMKYNPLYVTKDLREGAGARFARIELPEGWSRPILDEEREDPESVPKNARAWRGDPLTSETASESTTFDFGLDGEQVRRPKKGGWKTNATGMQRLKNAERLLKTREFANFKKYFHDFSASVLGNLWADTMGTAEQDKIYVVQTTTKVVQRCLLMTTDPGDLVLDPTCGSGTTAYVAEQWGRRWITLDTSRVALALAKQRLLTARFPYFKLRELSAEDLTRNPKGTWLKNAGDQPKTFSCTTLPHVTLKSIARNTSLDPIFAKHGPILAQRLQELNAALKQVTPEQSALVAEKLKRKEREEGKKSITEADRRRWLLPGNPQSPTRQQQWQEWEVPFDTDPDWPKPLQEALKQYRQAWRSKMDEVNQCIAANAEMEELVDKPEEVPGIVRVSGPFTVEGVIAVEEGLETPIGGAPEPLETFIPTADASQPTSAAEVQNVEAHLDKVIRLLKASGVDFPGNKNMKFGRLEPITGASLIHAEGEWANGDQRQRHVAVTIGPDVGNLTAYQVEDVIRDANRKAYDDVVFAAFGFDAAAQDAIAGGSHPKLRLHMALIRPDVAMGDLLKTQPGSQLFTVFSAPRIKGPAKQSDGTYTIEVEGMDVYDPVTNTLFPTNKERIAAWWLDSDYDGRTFCICQAFFPDKTKWDKLARALGDRGIIEEDAFSALSGLESLPFPRPPRLKKGEKWRVAVKVIDPRGNEGMRVMELP
ncbi:MAG: site-specific DNA-methyltransferase [Verrucomicrobiota bacterium]|jgi:adenine-specific DNA-methyltransferase